MVENISMVEQYFVERHIKLKRDWLLEALKFVTAANPQIHLVDSIYQQWLFTDLKESTEPIDGLSKLIDGRSFQEPYIFQIQSLSDIGTSNWKQSKRLADPLYEEPTEFDQPNPFSGLCCFSLRLSDGVVELKAFEKKRVPDLPTIACPGSKILVYGKVELCRGYLFLTKENCQLLGGQKPTQCVPTVPLRQMSEQRNASGSSLIREGPNCGDTTERQKPESRSIGEGPNCFDMTERQKPESRSIGEGPNCFDMTERQNWQPKRAKPNNDSDNSKNTNGGEWQRKMASASSFKPDGPTHEEDDSELFGRRVSKFLRSLSSTRRRRQACIGIEQLMMDFDEEEERNANGTAN